MTTPLPPGTPRIQPFLSYPDVSAAIDGLSQAFGFHVQESVSGPDGTVEHAVLDIYDGRVMARRSDEAKRPAGSITYVYVDDGDAHFAIASKSPTVKIVSPPVDEPWGDRIYGALDVGGHSWAFAQRLATAAI